MRFESILFGGPGGGGDEVREEPPFFRDLNLDQLLESVTSGRRGYDLKPFFYAPLREASAVRYRQEVLRDLEGGEVFASISEFARSMRLMRDQLALSEKLRYRHQKESWFLDAVKTYCGAVRSLAKELAERDARSRGLRSLREYLRDYTESGDFASLESETLGLKEDLAGVRYSVRIKGNQVKVGDYAGDPDYSAEVEETFAKFEQGATNDYRVKFPDPPEMNHVEGRILELVARLNPGVFGALDEYYERYTRRGDYLDARVGVFDREVQFYLAYLEYIERFKKAGLPFCYPEVSEGSKEVRADETFDLALAERLVSGGEEVVKNDFHLAGAERALVVTGPNQGGKTTLARAFGQVHYLAGLGLPVPGKEARLPLPDRIFTHFEREEDLSTLRGKLEDELVRVHDILQRATGESVLIMNESFSSTTLEDALTLGTAVMGRIRTLDLLCVYVTFVDELASLDEGVVSMVSTVDPENPARRTYKVVRRPADGLAYAAALAESYGLTYERLKERVAKRVAERDPERAVR